MKLNKTMELIWIAALFTVGFYAVGRSETVKSSSATPQAQASQSSKSSAQGTVISQFEAADWENYKATGTTFNTSLVPGKKGQALSMDFNLSGAATWVALSRKWSLGSTEGKGIQFQMKSKVEAGTPMLEVKFVDADGSVFGKKIPVTTQENWETVTILPTDFTYWWGGNNTLEKVEKLDIAISGDNSKGMVALDEMQLIPSQSAKK